MSADTSKKSRIYALRNGKKPGLYDSWEAMQNQLIGWKGEPDFRKFKTQAKAQAFLEKLGSARPPPTPKSSKVKDKVDKPQSKRASKATQSSSVRVYPAKDQEIPYHENTDFFPWILKPCDAVVDAKVKRSLPDTEVTKSAPKKKPGTTPAPPATQSIAAKVPAAGVSKKAVSRPSPQATESVVAKVPNEGITKRSLPTPAPSPTRSIIKKVPDLRPLYKAVPMSTPSLAIQSVVTDVSEAGLSEKAVSVQAFQACQPVPAKAPDVGVRKKAASGRAPPSSVQPVRSRSYYAVKKGFKRGVYTSWAQCKAHVHGYCGKGGSGPIYKKFPTTEEATAWLKGAIPRGAQVDSRLPDSLRWDGAGLTDATSSPGSGRSTLSKLDEVRSQGFTTTGDGALVVYTDGSARNNGKKGARAGSGVWWGKHGVAKASGLSERVPGELQTNNRGEMLAIIRALETCPYPDLPLEIRTDSRYCIDCVHSFFPIWLQRGFNNMIGEAVKNQDLIVHLLTLLSQRKQVNGVRFQHVRAHRGEVGNEGADRLAVKGNKKPDVPPRTNWFTMRDLNRYRRQQAIRLAIMEVSEQEFSGDSKPSLIGTPGMSAEARIQELLELVEHHSKRLANADSATADAVNGRSGLSEAVAAELRELKELVDVDVDFHADLWLSPEEQAALAAESEV